MGTLDPAVIRRLDELDDASWAGVVLRVTKYAVRKVERLAWRGPLIEGKEARDLAMEAIADLLSGARTWDLERYPNVLAFLESVVDSKVSNLRRSADHRTRAPLQVDETPGERIERIPHPLSDAESTTIMTNIVERATDSLDGDADLEIVLLRLADGYKPGDIAAELKVPIGEIYNRLRRMRRRLDGLLSNLRRQE